MKITEELSLPQKQRKGGKDFLRFSRESKILFTVKKGASTNLWLYSKGATLGINLKFVINQVNYLIIVV